MTCACLISLKNIFENEVCKERNWITLMPLIMFCFVDAASERVYPDIYRLFPNARIQHIDGAGHWVHAEKPHQFLAAVESFLLSASDP